MIAFVFHERLPDLGVLGADRLERAAAVVAAGLVVLRPIAFGGVLHGDADPCVGVAEPFVLHARCAGDLVPGEVGVPDADLRGVNDDAPDGLFEHDLPGRVVQRHLVVGGELLPIAGSDGVFGGLAVGDPERVVDLDDTVKVAAEQECAAVGVG